MTTFFFVCHQQEEISISLHLFPNDHFNKILSSEIISCHLCVCLDLWFFLRVEGRLCLQLWDLGFVTSHSKFKIISYCILTIYSFPFFFIIIICSHSFPLWHIAYVLLSSFFTLSVSLIFPTLCLIYIPISVSRLIHSLSPFLV